MVNANEMTELKKVEAILKCLENNLYDVEPSILIKNIEIILYGSDQENV